MKKIVVIGGGTGNFTVLSGLKNYPLDITAVVNMADNGGSTGILRDEIGVLPPGDVRQCLVALSNSSRLMRDLFNYRFEAGSLSGHSFGNFFLSALEKVTGSFESAVEEASQILSIKGRVLPVTYDPVELCCDLGKGHIIRGEKMIDQFGMHEYPHKKLFIEPEVSINPKVEKALLMADLIVIAPGSLYSSLLPNFLVRGVPESIRQTKAKIAYVCNLVNKPNETAGYTLDDYVGELEKVMDRPLDFVLFNNKQPENELLKKYAEANELLVGDDNHQTTYQLIEKDLLKDTPQTQEKSDTLISRSFIRHDNEKLGAAIYELLERI